MPDARVMPGDERGDVLLFGDAGGEHGTRGHRGQPRAGPHRDLPAGAEDRVQDRAGRGRVQAVLQRDPGDAGVAQVLRNDQGRDGDAGDQVAAQPGAVVGAELAEYRALR